MSYKNVFIWLCGLWSLGLGLRITVELLACDGWIHVPKHPLNIWFDFVPLMLFGLITTYTMSKKILPDFRVININDKRRK